MDGFLSLCRIPDAKTGAGGLQQTDNRVEISGRGFGRAEERTVVNPGSQPEDGDEKEQAGDGKNAPCPARLHQP